MNQTPNVVISVDAKNSYDLIENLVTSMKNQHFGVRLKYLLVLFATTQSINIFLRTRCRVSEIFYTGSQDRPFQGATQGNGSTPPIWLTFSMFLVRYSYGSKLVLVRKTPMSLDAYQIAEFFMLMTLT